MSLTVDLILSLRIVKTPNYSLFSPQFIKKLRPLVFSLGSDLLLLWPKLHNRNRWEFFFIMGFPGGLIHGPKLICGPNIPGSYAILFFTASGLYFHHQSHPQMGIVFVMAPSPYSFWSYFSALLQ